MDLFDGHVFGPLQVLRRVQATVFKARRGNEEVCLKVPPRGERYAATWRAEIQALQRCRHPHVVELVDVIESDCHRVGLVFPWMQQGDLVSLMRREETTDVAPLLARQLLYGIEYIHEQGVVHGDLKPENVLVKGRDENDVPQLVLADFDAACVDFVDNKPHLSGGRTIDFRAPELICHPPLLLPVSDVWSAACTIYELLTNGDCLFETPLYSDEDSDEDNEGSDNSDNDGDSEDNEGSDNEGDSEDNDGDNPQEQKEEEEEDSDFDADAESESAEEATAARDIAQLLVIQECLGSFPPAFTRRFPGIFARAGGRIHFRLLRDQAPALVDAPPASYPLERRLEENGVEAPNDLLAVLWRMLAVNPRTRCTAAEALAMLT